MKTVIDPVFGELSLVDEVHAMLMHLYIHTKEGNSWHVPQYSDFSDRTEIITASWEKVFFTGEEESNPSFIKDVHVLLLYMYQQLQPRGPWFDSKYPDFPKRVKRIIQVFEEEFMQIVGV